MTVKSIRIDHFDYPLPDERIALHPLQQRDACRMLHADSRGNISHRIFSDLPSLLRPDTLIIANETKVIRARMEFFKESGARIEIFLLEPLSPADYAVNFASTGPCVWACMVGNRKKWKEGRLKAQCRIPDVEKPVAVYVEKGRDLPGNAVEITFSWDNPAATFAEIIEALGNIPIPPYLNRKSEESDTTDYQTVYAAHDGSVAAPTAGLHFTPRLLGRLREDGHEFATVTLHVGAGTFQPVKSDTIGDHPMHTEWISVEKDTVLKIIKALREGRDILAVGTTSVRTLESLPYLAMAKAGVTQWTAYSDKAAVIDTVKALESLVERMEADGTDAIQAQTSIMIAPGFQWRIVNRLITNFHQPKSTLLLLVSSFLGGDRWREVYREALDNNYRFLSYGDACLFEKGAEEKDDINTDIADKSALKSITLPYSKSMFMRAATLMAVRHPERLESLRGYADCDDSANYLNALLGLMEAPSDGELHIDIGEGAAPLRFFVALAASLPGKCVTVDGAPGLRRRPIAPLVETLRHAGADIEYAAADGCLPLRIKGRKLNGADLQIETSKTSQYLSAILLVSPLWTDFRLPGNLFSESGEYTGVSSTYLDMTLKMMREKDIHIEADWSAAAFFYELLYVLAGSPDFPLRSLSVKALTPPDKSLQGDSVCMEIFSNLGITTCFPSDGGAIISTGGSSEKPSGGEKSRLEFNLGDTPDLVPALTVALAVREVPFTIHGTGHLKYKESNRAEVLREELGKLGYTIEVGTDSISSDGVCSRTSDTVATIDPHGDHRIAMAFAPLRILGKVRIDHPEVVSKSFPNFWNVINSIFKTS